MAGRAIVMPKLGLTMTEGMLSEWKVAPGDRVEAGQVLFVVETDKIANDIEASEAGVIEALLARPGETLPVGATVAMMAPGEGAAPGVAAAPAASAASTLPERIVATPLARRMARERGVDLAHVSGSGPRGRIMAADVPDEGAGPVSGPPPLALPATAPGVVHELGAFQKIAARRLSESKREIPHFYVFADADVTDLATLRAQLNAASDGQKLTVNHFLIAAVARALAQMPEMNRVWAGEALRALPAIDVGLAVEGRKGLVAPVLRDLGGLSLDEIAARACDLVERARAGRFAAGELEGGAIAISNVGMFGASALVPIINPGQSSILGVGAAQGVFRPDAAGQPVLRQVLGLCLSCDHRVIDGAQAARFLQAVCRNLETPALLLRRPSFNRETQ